jgi:hypothetical protein
MKQLPPLEEIKEWPHCFSGSVLSQGSTTGPSGISIELMAPDSMSILQTVTTNDEGHFDFFGVSPGSYFVRYPRNFCGKVRLEVFFIENFQIDQYQRWYSVTERMSFWNA